MPNSSFWSSFVFAFHLPKFSQQAFVVEGAESMQALHGHDERLHGRRVHEIERKQVVDSHGLEREHCGGQIGALYLGHIGGEHFVAIGALRVQAVAFAGTGAAGSARALLGLCLRDGRDHKTMQYNRSFTKLIFNQ